MQINQSLINLCKKEDRKAQQQLYMLLYKDALRLTLRYTKNEEDAKDVMNQAFFKVFTRIDQFNGTGDNFFAWIKKILVHQALDHLRAAAFKNSLVSLEEANHLKHEEDQQDFDNENIIQWIQKLPLTMATVFNLFVMEGYNHREISKMLGITENNSKYYLHAARNKLKNWIFKSEEK